MAPYETLIIAEQEVVIIMTYLVALATGKSSKNTLYFGFNCSYLKNKRGDPHFLLLELSDQEAKIKLSAKFKSSVQGIQSDLTICGFLKVALIL